MKKFIAIILTLTIAFACLGAGNPVTLSDVQGTKYQIAVENLVGMSVVSGYSDGTFQPENKVNRAEMATMLVKTIYKSFGDIQTPPFTDVSGHWAEDYITVVYSLGIVNGVTPTQFMPGSLVTYAQAAAMILRALGHTDAELGGTWPSNYMNKAAELGLFDLIDEEGKADEPAIRGDVALMLSAVAQPIRDKYYDVIEEIEKDPADNGKLTDFSGRAIGFPITVASELNGDGDAVDELEFLMGGETYYLNTKDLGDVTTTDFKPAGKFTGDLYVARMNNGIVRDLTIAPAATLSRYVELTADGFGVGAFRIVTAIANERVTLTGAALAEFGYADEVFCYEAVFDGDELETFVPVSDTSLDVGDYIRAWDLDADWAGVAVVVVIIDKDDVVPAGNYNII